MSDRIEIPCRECGSLLHHVDNCHLTTAPADRKKELDEADQAYEYLAALADGKEQTPQQRIEKLIEWLRVEHPHNHLDAVVSLNAVAAALRSLKAPSSEGKN